MRKIDLGALKKFPLCPRKDLDLAVCVGNGGQSFSWTKLHPENIWTNIITSELVILGSDDEKVFYYAEDSSTSVECILREYFRLDIELDDLLQSWSQQDSKLGGKCRRTGIRIINQDPFETFISFLCSQNNGIARISKMVHSLKSTYGALKYKIAFEGNEYEIYDFPSPERLINQEKELRELGFGYRAEYISQSCALITSKSSDYFQNLKEMPYETVVEELLQFPGVGPKVADCIALFGIGKLESVPIDTHILKIAEQYGFKSPTQSLTLKSYKYIGDMFRKLYGHYAGWAHSLLFTHQLKSFKKS